jgi:hypothetical protein
MTPESSSKPQQNIPKWLGPVIIVGLGVSLGDMQARLAEIGRVLGTPWRADEKAAAMAAWIGLAGVKRSNRKSSAGGEKT